MDEITTLSDYGRPITYFGVAYSLTKEDAIRLSAIDKAIQERLRDVIYFAPDGSRHITIMNITSVVEGCKNQDVIQSFEGNVESYRDKLKAIASGLDPFEVRFTHLQASSSAIFLRGKDQGQILAIRDELASLLRLGGRVIDAGFIHSTQARYKKEVSVNKVREQLEDIAINVPIIIDKIALVRADVSFSKPHVVLEEFMLKGKN